MEETEFDPRARTREIAAQFAERGDSFGWFEELYKESEGNTERIPWADLEPNPFFRKWAERTGLKGEGRKALVVGCGLGDDAKYLDDLGFKVTALVCKLRADHDHLFAIDGLRYRCDEVDVTLKILIRQALYFQPYHASNLDVF